MISSSAGRNHADLLAYVGMTSDNRDYVSLRRIALDAVLEGWHARCYSMIHAAITVPGARRQATACGHRSAVPRVTERAGKVFAK